jgi:rhomboid protease GluP
VTTDDEAGPDLPRRFRVSPTALLLAANLGVFAAMVLSGVDPADPSGESLVRWGAIERERVRHGEWWRLATAMFVHVGAIHVAVNMYSLWSVGRLVERLFGATPYLVLYVLSGLFASAASVYAHPAGVSAGASGAIFGIVGGLGSFMVRVGRHVFQRRAVRGMLTQLVLVVAVNLAIGFRVPMIDNAAHVGGLVSGIALGWLLAGSPTPDALRRRNARAAVVAAVALAALVVVAVRLLR